MTTTKRRYIKSYSCRGKSKKTCLKNKSCRLTQIGKREPYCRNIKNTKMK